MPDVENWRLSIQTVCLKAAWSALLWFALIVGLYGINMWCAVIVARICENISSKRVFLPQFIIREGFISSPRMHITRQCLCR